MEAVRGINVPMYTTLRRTTVAFTMIVEYFLSGKRHSNFVIGRYGTLTLFFYPLVVGWFMLMKPISDEKKDYLFYLFHACSYLWTLSINWKICWGRWSIHTWREYCHEFEQIGHVVLVGELENVNSKWIYMIKPEGDQCIGPLVGNLPT